MSLGDLRQNRRNLPRQTDGLRPTSDVRVRPGLCASTGPAGRCERHAERGRAESRWFGEVPKFGGWKLGGWWRAWAA